MHLSENNPLARFEEFENHLADPGGFMNTSTNLNQSASIVKEGSKASRQRARLYRRRRKNMRPRIVVPPPPRRPVPHRLLRHIWSLTSDEALVYAKKEMENISSVTNDPDPDLYAPLFRNASIFQRDKLEQLM